MSLKASPDPAGPGPGGAEPAAAGQPEGSREAAALEILWRLLCAPDGRTAHCRKCQASRPFHRVSARRAYACDRCGAHRYPAADTPFAGSPVDLATWFDATTITIDSGQRVKPRRLAEILGVSYKRAWRMSKRIQDSLTAGGPDAVLLPRLAESWRELSRSADGQPARQLSPEDRIRAAACRVMAERGVSSTRIADIANEAGVSGGTIHYYFRSKDEALLDAFRWAGEQLHATLRELRDSNVGPVEHVRRLIELSVPSDQDLYHEYLLWLEVWVRVRSHPDFLDECMKMSRRWYEAVVEVFGQGVAEGRFVPVAPVEDVGERYVAIAESLAYRASLGYNEMPAGKARGVLARFTAQQLGIPAELLAGE